MEKSGSKSAGFFSFYSMQLKSKFQFYEPGWGFTKLLRQIQKIILKLWALNLEII